MNQKEKLITTIEQSLSFFENYFGSTFDNYQLPKDDTPPHLPKTPQQLADGYLWFQWTMLDNCNKMMEPSRRKPIYTIEPSIWRNISGLYDAQFPPLTDAELDSLVAESVHVNEAFTYLKKKKVKNSQRRYGLDISETLELADRQNGYHDNEVFVPFFHSVNEDYYRAIIEFDESAFPPEKKDELLKQAQANASTAKQVLNLIKEHTVCIDDFPFLYDIYWRPTNYEKTLFETDFEYIAKAIYTNALIEQTQDND